MRQESTSLKCQHLLKRNRKTLVILTLLSMSLQVQAQQCAVDSTLISWDTVTWMEGSTANSYLWPLIPEMLDDTVDFELNVISGGTFEMTSPKVADAELSVEVDPANDGTSGYSPTKLKVTFDPPVRCVKFKITDIDAVTGTGGQDWIDSLYIFGNDTSVTPSIIPLSTTPTFAIDSGEVVGISDAGTGSDGDLMIDFGGTMIDSVVIQYMDAIENNTFNRSAGFYGDLSFSQESLLPVELISYDVEKDPDCRPMIKWQTTHEYDIEYYAIEYSYDGINFSNAAFVQPRNTYSGLNRYEQVIDRKLNSQNYFRLIKKEMDGTEAILAMESLDGRSCYDINGISIYPNPVRQNHFYLEIETVDSKPAEIVIIDQRGKIINQVDYNLREGTNWFKVNSRYLRPGTYFVQFRTAKDVITRKINILH